MTSNTLLPSLPRLRIENDLLRIFDRIDADNGREKKKTKKKVKQDKDKNIEEFVIAWQEKIFNRVCFDFDENFDGEMSSLDRISRLWS